MKTILKWCMALIVSSLFLACQQDAMSTATPSDADADSIFTLDYIRSICQTQPDRAMEILDMAEACGKLKPVDIYGFRAILYNNVYGDSEKSLNCTLQAYDESVRTADTVNIIKSSKLLTALYYEVSHYALSQKYAMEGTELAYKIGDRKSMIYYLQFVAYNKYEMGDRTGGLNYFEKALKMYASISEDEMNSDDVRDLLFLQLQQMKYLEESDDHVMAASYLPQCQKTISRLAVMPDLPDGYIETYQAQYWAIASCIYHSIGERVKAEDVYRKLMATHCVQTDFGCSLPVCYQLMTARWSEAIRILAREDSAHIADGDTLSSQYIKSVLLNKIEALRGMGRHHEASDAAFRLIALSDSLNARSQQQQAAELAAIYGARAKDIEILEKDAQLSRQRLLIIIFAILSLAAVAFALMMVYYNRIIRRKNKAAIFNIEEQLNMLEKMRQQDQVANVHPAMSDDGQQFEPCDEDEKALFDSINRAIVVDKLYLQPDISRETICDMFGIGRIQCSSLFRKYAKCSMPSYINRLRLNDSIVLMHEHPEYSIEAIAHACGFERQNFYRRFVERYGITPSEYKKSVAEK